MTLRKKYSDKISENYLCVLKFQNTLYLGGGGKALTFDSERPHYERPTTM